MRIARQFATRAPVIDLAGMEKFAALTIPADSKRFLQGRRPVRVKCAQPLQDPRGIWLRWITSGARAGSRSDRFLFLTVHF
jgi:hypothetical protein